MKTKADSTVTTDHDKADLLYWASSTVLRFMVTRASCYRKRERQTSKTTERDTKRNSDVSNAFYYCITSRGMLYYMLCDDKDMHAKAPIQEQRHIN